MTAKVEYLDLYRPPKRVVLAKVLISKHEFINLVEIVEKYIRLLQPLRKNPKNLEKALEIVAEIKLGGMLSHHVRQEYYHQLDDFLDDLYAEVHS